MVVQAEVMTSIKWPSVAISWEPRTEEKWAAFVFAAHQAGQLLNRAELRQVELVAAYLLWLPLFCYRYNWAKWATVLLSAVQCYAAFPRTANHAFLAMFAGALMALGSQKDLLLLVVIPFFWGGVQKCVHGLWFDGQMLGWLIVNRTDVVAPLRPLFSDETAKRLALGDYRLSGGWLVVTNFVWLLELITPTVLFVRTHAWWILLCIGWSLQLVAHEWEFALLLSFLCISAAPLRVQKFGFAAVLGGVLVLAATRLGWLPIPYAFLETVGR